MTMYKWEKDAIILLYTTEIHLEVLNLPKTNLKTYAYDIIKDNIIRCKLMPGEVINEQILTEELSISRTPIREALNRLEQEGYVEIMPKIGVVVKHITYKDVIEIFEVRQVLEPYSIARFGDKLESGKLLYYKSQIMNPSDPVKEEDYFLDTEMHRYFFHVCENKYFIDVLRHVLDQNNRVIIVSRGNGARMHDSKKEHIAIIDKLLEGDLENATELMKTHLKNCREASLEYYTKYYHI